MNGFFLTSTYFGVFLSLAAYFIGIAIKKKVNFSLVNPLLISVVLVIAFLLLFDLDYDAYYAGGRYLSYFLTPSTVCLAIPLYRQLEILRRNLKAILWGSLAGVLSSLGGVLLFARIFRLNYAQYVTLLPKSITTAIGMGLAEEMGGIPAITVAVIVVTGIFGNLTAVLFCRIFRIQNPLAAGLAIGTSSHAMGTTKALELGEVEGAMSSLAIVVSGIMTAAFASFFAMLY
ncbi:MAG: LrgB family protein [Peptococcaceae bacterium]|nr:LrgB family protein [Peptococcaceae bacterium]